MATFHLKTWVGPFGEMWLGNKTFDIRMSNDTDRAFDLADTVVYHEYSISRNDYTGRWIEGQITYLMRGVHQPALPWLEHLAPGSVVMSFRELGRGDDSQAFGKDPRQVADS